MTSFSNFKRILLSGALALLAIVAYAGVPSIRMFYPGKTEEGADPLKLKKTATLYLYFEKGYEIYSARSRVVKDGVELGICEYEPASSIDLTVVKAEQKGVNAFMKDIDLGVFSMEVFEVVYWDTTEGKEYTYSDKDNPIDVVQYISVGPNGYIEKETGFNDKHLISYYAPDSDMGVKTYRFNKAVLPGVKARLNYGYDDYNVTEVPCTLSDDGLTVTVDFRGICLNVARLAPGVKFVDEKGKPVDPPSSIALEITPLDCADGGKIETTSYSIDGSQSTQLEGTIWVIWYYSDITLPTPVLMDAQFYNSAAPEIKYKAINTDTDMMELTLENASSMASADVCFTLGNYQKSVTDGNYTKAGNIFRVPIPADLVGLGNGLPTISLENVKYTMEDGAEHNIRPLELSKGGVEVFSLAEMLELPDGTKLVLNSVDGITVTLSNEFGYTFAEDETTGINIATSDFSRVFDEGSLVKGYIAGTYMGNGIFNIDVASSDYTIESVDVTDGEAIYVVEVLYTGVYNNRLVSLYANNDMSMAYDKASGEILVNESLIAVTDFVPGLTLPEDIVKLTGVYYTEPSTGDNFLMLRNNHDINDGERFDAIETITVEPAKNVDIFTITGVKVANDGNLPAGLYITSEGKKLFIK